MKRLPRQLPVRQQGSVLAVVLVFLVFVAIFSVMAMQSATLESRMVATATFQEEALANAELGLKLGEQAIIAEIDDGDAIVLGITLDGEERKQSALDFVARPSHPGRVDQADHLAVPLQVGVDGVACRAGDLADQGVLAAGQDVQQQPA